VFSGVVAIGHNAALGASTLALGNNTATATVVASGAPRTIANNVTLNGTSATPGAIGGSQDLTLNGSFTNSNTDGYLSVNNTANTTLGGPVYLSDSLATPRTLHVTGTGNALISGVIANANGAGQPGGLRYDGTGTLTVSAVNTYTGATAVTANGGTLVLTQGLKTGNALSISNGATAVIPESGPNTYEPPGVVPSGDNSKGSKVNALTIAATGKLDIGNSDMAVDYVDPQHAARHHP
jgi:autotransporter-associated beta strand protein